MKNLSNRIGKLSRQQRILLGRKLELYGSDRTEIVDAAENLRLAAFYSSDAPIDSTVFITELKRRLPAYMIPADFVFLSELPRLPNGKIDSNSLNIPRKSGIDDPNSGNDRPLTDLENRLVLIWEDVLGFSPVRITDNFFEIGGDSILSIQIVAKARKQGIDLAPNQLFEHQTILELAQFANAGTDTKIEETVTGKIPLLPIQHWFFEEHKNAPHHWNQGLLFELPTPLNIDILETSVVHLVRRHDGLRTRFQAEGRIRSAFIESPEEVDVFTRFDLRQLNSEEFDSAVRRKTLEFQSRFDLSAPNLFRVIHFSGNNGLSKLVFLANHLIIDTISWQILLDDLQTIYVQLSAGEEISLPPKTASIKDWSIHLEELAASGEFDREIEFWRSQTEADDQFPADSDKKLPVSAGNLKIRYMEMDGEVTKLLSENRFSPVDLKTDELLVAALVFALERWRGVKQLCIGLEQHGRGFTEGNIDLTNTVGWFTSYYPVRLELNDDSNLEARIVAIKEKLRRVPNKGLGYGILRYLKGDTGLVQKPPVIFNYMGSKRFLDSKLFGKGTFIYDGAISPESEENTFLAVNLFIEDGKLKIRFSYNKDLYRAESIAELSAHYDSVLRELASNANIGEGRRYTTSDFPDVEIKQADLDNLIDQIERE